MKNDGRKPKQTWVKHHGHRNLAVLSIVATTLILIIIGLASVPSTGVRVGQQAPDFTVQDVSSGTNFRLYDHMGQPMLLEFMTTSCPHCTRQAPILSDLFSKYGAQMHFVSISIDPFTDSPSVLMSYSQMHTMPWTFARDPNQLGSTYGVTGTPTMFLLDRTGIIKFRFSGETDLQTLENGVASVT